MVSKTWGINWNCLSINITFPLQSDENTLNLFIDGRYTKLWLYENLNYLTFNGFNFMTYDKTTIKYHALWPI